MKTTIKELKQLVKQILQEDTQGSDIVLYPFVKDEVFRYLNYYHSQYFRGYSQEDLQNLINKIKSKVGDQASQEEIETRAKSYLENNSKYDIDTINKRVSQFVMDTIIKDKPADIVSYISQHRLTKNDFKQIIDRITNKAVQEFIQNDKKA